MLRQANIAPCENAVRVKIVVREFHVRVIMGCNLTESRSSCVMSGKSNQKKGYMEFFPTASED